MEEKSAFGMFAKYFIGSLYALWVIAAFTGLGTLIGVLINLATNPDIFIPAITYSGALIGLFAGIAFAIYRFKDPAL